MTPRRPITVGEHNRARRRTRRGNPDAEKKGAHSSTKPEASEPPQRLVPGEGVSLACSFQPEEHHDLLRILVGDTEAKAPRAGAVSASVAETSADPRSWLSALLTALVATRFPGPGSHLLHEDLHFSRTPQAGDELDVRLVARTIDPPVGQEVHACLECRVTNPRHELVAEGLLEVSLPHRPRGAGPGGRRDRKAADADDRSPPSGSGARLYALVAVAREGLARRGRAPLRTAVVHPVEPAALAGAVAARRAGLIEPILVGPTRKLRHAARLAGLDLGAYELVETEHSHAAAERAVALAHRGEVAAIMKGSLHTDELMHAALVPEGGLRTARRMSHVFVIDVHDWPRLLLLTDAAINVTPDLEAKRDIVQNAIGLAHVLGVEHPRVALLSSVETVEPRIPSTLDAAALCKMADRGQITGGILDGPLAFDNAASSRAAHTKGIVSEVAGRADVLVVPDLDAGNMLAKGIEYLAGAQLAGIVLGARVPIVLTSRADLEPARLASCALAVLLALATDGTRETTP